MPEMSVEDIMQAAKESGIEIQDNSDRPGVFIILDDGSKREAKFEDLFPDLA